MHPPFHQESVSSPSRLPERCNKGVASLRAHAWLQVDVSLIVTCSAQRLVTWQLATCHRRHDQSHFVSQSQSHGPAVRWTPLPSPRNTPSVQPSFSEFDTFFWHTLNLLFCLASPRKTETHSICLAECSLISLFDGLCSVCAIPPNSIICDRVLPFSIRLSFIRQMTFHNKKWKPTQIQRHQSQSSHHFILTLSINCCPTRSQRVQRSVPR